MIGNIKPKRGIASGEAEPATLRETDAEDSREVGRMEAVTDTAHDKAQRSHGVLWYVTVALLLYIASFPLAIAAIVAFRAESPVVLWAFYVFYAPLNLIFWVFGLELWVEAFALRMNSIFGV